MTSITLSVESTLLENLFPKCGRMGRGSEPKSNSPERNNKHPNAEKPLVAKLSANQYLDFLPTVPFS